MDDPSLLPFLNTNGNGHHYAHDAMASGIIEHDEDEFDGDDGPEGEDEEDDDEEQEERNLVYPEDEIEEDEIEEDEIDDVENHDEQDMILPPPPPPPPTEQLIQAERGGRRKGVPRRLQIPTQGTNAAAAATQARLLPASSTKQPSTSTGRASVTSDQDENHDHEDDYHHHPDQSASLVSDFFSQHLNGNHNDSYDENNNSHYYEDESPLEIVDDILADIVTYIVRDIRQQKQSNGKQRTVPAKVNGHSHSKPSTNGLSKPIVAKHEHKASNGKHPSSDLAPKNSIKSSKSPFQQSLQATAGKLSDSSTLFNELSKMMQLNSQQQLVKQKHSLSPSSSSAASFTPSPSAKRQKISEASSPSTAPLSLQQQQHHQQLLWQMTQQFLMSPQATDIDSSSLLKQQLLGLNPPTVVQPKRPGRPPKQPTHPQVMRSSTNMIPPTSHSSTSASSFERANFAPRRRGRPPKYVTERGGLSGLSSSHELDPSSYDQLFATIENSVNGNAGRTSAAAFQSALASMLGHQAGLSIPPPPVPSLPSAIRNGTPASMMKQSAGQTRHSLPSSSSMTKAAKLSQGLPGAANALDLPLMATKKRGPGRPPKNQSLVDSHQVLQATKRMNSSSANNNNNFPPTMVPSSPSSFDLNAAFVEMLQQQQQLQHQQQQQHLR